MPGPGNYTLPSAFKAGGTRSVRKLARVPGQNGEFPEFIQHNPESEGKTSLMTLKQLENKQDENKPAFFFLILFKEGHINKKPYG